MSIPAHTPSESHESTHQNHEAITTNEQLVMTAKTLQCFRRAAQFTDVTLCVGEEELPCHKAILAAGSKYFHAMFSSAYKEQETAHVYLNHVSPWALHRLLDFAYSGELDLSPSIVQDVFTAASLLDYPIAVTACVHFMEQHLEIGNCLGVEALADMHGLTALSEAARKLALENFSSLISESLEWVSIPLRTVVSYLSSNDLDVPSEQCVWRACMRWVESDPESRLCHLPALMKHVRLNQLGHRFLLRQLKHNSLVQESHATQEIIHSTLKEDSLHSLPAPRPATLKRPTLVVLGGLNNHILNCMQSYSPVKTSWLPCPSMPVDSLAWFAVSVVSNVLFVMGGIKAGTIMSSMFEYSPVRGTWSQRAPMPEARARHTTLAVGRSHIFVFGGRTLSSSSESTTSSSDSTTTALRSNSEPQTNYLTPPRVTMARSILRYDICTDTWFNVGQSNHPRSESRIVMVDEGRFPLTVLQPSPQNVGCTCEIEADDLSPRHEYYESSSNGLNSYGGRHRQHSSHLHGERSLVEIGGVTDENPRGTDKVSFYCLQSDLTVFQTNDYIELPQQMRYVNCAVHPVSKLVYILWEQTSELSVLDLAHHTLRPLAPLPIHPPYQQARIYAGLTWVNDRLYVVGGYSEFIGDGRRPTHPREDVHCYDTDTNSWSLVSINNGTVPRAIFGCVCLNM